MFKSLDLSLIVEFMLMFYKDKPIDWLLDHIMWVKVCNPEKDAVRKHTHICTHARTHAYLKPEFVCVSETLRPAEGKPEDPLQAVALPARRNSLVPRWKDSETQSEQRDSG